jgi:hypothetical protein
MKQVHYMHFYLGSDAEGNDISESKNAADFIYEKLNAINSYIKDNIDKEVTGFLFEEFFTTSDSVKNIPINSPDLLKYIKTKLKKDLKEPLENGEALRVVFIFDPKANELIWENEFLELSERLEITISIMGYNSQYEDIVTQAYDKGDYDTGIIACDLEVFDGISLSEYMKSESPECFPNDSIFKISNYSKKN